MSSLPAGYDNWRLGLTGYSYEEFTGADDPREDWAVHQPAAFDAPIPGVHWYSGCNPDRPRVDPDTGVCEDCGATACPSCGREECPDHPAASANVDRSAVDFASKNDTEASSRFLADLDAA